MLPKTSAPPLDHKTSVSGILILEIKVVVDLTTQEYHGDDTRQYVLAVMRIVKDIFQDAALSRPVHIMVSQLVMLQTPMPQFSLCTSVFCNFCKWAQNDPNDVVALIIRDRLANDTTVGLSNLGKLCHDRHSCTVVNDQGLVGTAITLAHDLGHLFGVLHDEETGCGNNLNIMSSYGNIGSQMFHWSPCSVGAINRFLDQKQRVSCLSNLPRSLEAPGKKIYNKDEQCKLEFGNIYEYCDLKFPDSKDPCSSLSCQSPDKDFYCEFGAPMADHSDCSDINQPKWCIKGRCVPYIGSCEQSQWATWGEWTDCSRTCGGGTTYRKRKCQNKQEVCAYNCEGKSEDVRLCNIENCKTGIQTQKYDWCHSMNSTKGDYLCHCDGNKKNYVAYPDGFDVYDRTSRQNIQKCFRGKSKTFGCDGVMESGLKFDKCMVCNGDGGSCDLHVKRFSEKPKTLNRFYSFESIPAGSTGVVVKNRNEDFTAIGAKYKGDGNFLVQGSRLQDFPEPIVKDIELLIFYFYDVTADVSYEYYNMTVPQRYGWMAYCSGGISCRDLFLNKDVGDEKCFLFNKPNQKEC